MRAVAGTEPAAKVARLAKVDTTEVGAYSHLDQPDCWMSLKTDPVLSPRFDPLSRYALLVMMGVVADTLSAKDSLCESMRLDGAHEQAITCPLPHDELVQLQRCAKKARVVVDLAGQGDDLACAA